MLENLLMKRIDRQKNRENSEKHTREVFWIDYRFLLDVYE